MEISINFPAGENQVFSQETLKNDVIRKIRINGKECQITKMEIIDNGTAARITVDIPDVEDVIGEIIFEEYDIFSLGGEKFKINPEIAVQVAITRLNRIEKILRDRNMHEADCPVRPVEPSNIYIGKCTCWLSE